MIEAAILQIVFPINIVTSNLRGKAIRLVIYFPIIPELFFISPSFLSSKENKATSEPENNAENNNNIISNTIL